MLEARKYTLSELMKVMLKESSEHKNPVVGKNVWKDNSQNNVKAVEDIMKQTKEYNDVEEEKRSTNPENITDFNKTTLDVNFSYEPSKEYKERVKAQVQGYPSVLNKKESEIDKNESLDFEGNKEFYDNNSKKQKEVTNTKTDIKHSGLKSHNLPKEDFKDKNIFTNENKKMKRLLYNKVFLNEEHVIKKVPDDYKIDGNKFMMKDINGVEYIVECTKDKTVDYIYARVIKVNNPKAVNEQLERIKQLTNYNSSEYFASTTCESRKRENEIISENLSKVKKLANDKK